MGALSNTSDSDSRIELSSPAQQIIAHALETFGSERKAWMWLERPNSLLSGSAPIEILQGDPARFELVEDELTRIDYGVFA